MSLYQQIKEDQLEARKSRDTIRTALLTTLLGDVALIGKNAGGREPTDAEVVQMVKKYIKNNVEGYTGYNRHVTHDAELHILEHWLPKQLDEEGLKKVVEGLIADQPTANMGILMKALKASYDGQYDGALASKLIKEALA